jgi:hypothetical protein
VSASFDFVHVDESIAGVHGLSFFDGYIDNRAVVVALN